MSSNKKAISKFLLPAFYTITILLILLNLWNQQNAIRKGGDGPLYRNLMEQPSYIKRGFNPAETPLIKPHEWMRFNSPPLRVMNSPLPDLPKRTFLSPWGKPAEEFTIAILIEVGNDILDFLKTNPATQAGVYLGYIGENWEIYFNGVLARSEMHLDENGQITSHRNWRSVYFPLDSSLFFAGTNVLALRIVGDPALGDTGLYYASPYYIDTYSTIDGQQRYILTLALFGIFCFIGIYYLIIFLSVRKRQEIYNLYYSIFSFLICIYSLMRYGIVNYLIPDSNISIRLEFIALFMMVPVLGLFIEEMVWRKTTKITWAVLAVYFIFSVTQVFFCTQYGAEILMIWSVSVLIYFTYVFFYNILYFYFKTVRKNEKQKSYEDYTSSTFILNILVGSILVYLCGIYDILDTLFFHNSYGLFLYSTFVFHIGISITLAISFKRMSRAIGVYGKFTNKEVSQLAMDDEQVKTGGTLKHATIFFSDIRDFTKKSEAITKKFGNEGSDKIVGWLNNYLSRMVGCVEKTGGTIDKFIGDSVMAHWGAASTSGNLRKDALNAVYAALLMRAELVRMNRSREPGDEGNPAINIGCGINTGVVTAGQIGSEQRMEYTVIGDPVNLASRIESLNKTFGTDILISENTWSLIKDYVVVEEMPPVKVKGKENPIRLFAVVNLTSANDGPKTLADVRRLTGIKAPDAAIAEG